MTRRRASKRASWAAAALPRGSVTAALVAGFVFAVILAVLSPLLSGRRYAFRDLNHFYLPLYDYVAERSAEAWLPWWNPLDHTGLPLIGETSTATLYPLRMLVFAMPLSSEVALNVYLVVHLLLAAATAALLARRFGCDALGQATAALVYPLSGSVFALCCNPPFLVGAAWLPLVLASLLGAQPAPATWRRRQASIAWAGLALSMMVTGGDPQSALHAVLVVVAVVILRWAITRAQDDARRARVRRQRAAIELGQCAAAAGLALAMSGIQVAAAWDWSRQSDRTASVARRGDVYHFSVPPWHSVEALTPRPFGELFPMNRRVGRLLPGETRMWTPSIYAGLIVGFALLARLLRPRSYLAEPWLVVAVLALLASFGQFGLVWLLQQIPGLLDGRDSAIGGLYWALCHLVPGYDSFRYPAKWLPVFAIGGAMVAAQWITAPPARHERGVALALSFILAVAAGAAHWLTLQDPQELWPQRSVAAVDEYWGPLDLRRGFALVRGSCLVSLLLLIALVKLRSFSRLPRDARAGQPRLGWPLSAAWLVLIAIDCGWSALTMFPTVDIDRARRFANQVSPPAIEADRVLRTQAGMWPDRWRGSHSPNRPLEVAASEQAAWFGRWHLAERQAVFNSMVSLRSRRYTAFWQAAAKQTANMRPRQRQEFWAAVRGWLGIDGISHVDETLATAVEGHSLVYVERDRADEPKADGEHARSPGDGTRLVSRWRPSATMPELVAELGKNRIPLPHVPLAAADHRDSGTPELRRLAAGLYHVRCQAPCVLERGVFQDGNWQAAVTRRPGGESNWTAVLPSSQLKQAVLVPAAGEWKVRFAYRPWWRWPAIAISAAGWIAFFAVAWRSMRRAV